MQSILVVDDEPDVRLVARMILEQEGFEVHEASSGDEALERLRAGLQPAALLLDVRMPGTDGWEVLERIHGNPRTFGTLPVVIFTAYFANAAEAPRDFGQHEFFLRKPFEPNSLLEQVGAAIASRG